MQELMLLRCKIIFSHGEQPLGFLTVDFTSGSGLEEGENSSGTCLHKAFEITPSKE